MPVIDATDMGEQKGFMQFPYEFRELNPEVKAELTRLYKSPDIDFISVSPKNYNFLRPYCEDAANIYNMPLRSSDIFVASYQRSAPDIDFISVSPKNYNFLRPYCEDAANIYNMPLRSSDIFVASYQRSGTTWVQELVWLLANDLDYDTAKTVPLTHRYYFLELFMFYNEKYKENFLNNASDKEAAQTLINDMGKPVTGKLLKAPSPRFIKTHLPMSLLPPKLIDTAKMVYIARDPRDVAVSSYHHSRLFKVLDFPNPFKDFWNLFIKDLFTQTPFFEHLKEACELRHHPNMLFLFYEELSKDLPAVVRRVSDFLGKDLTEEQMAQLCDYLSFNNFKKNDSVNYEPLREFGILSSEETFIRRGKAGGWRDYFDKEMTQQAERWIADSLRDTDLHFPHSEN